MPRRRWSWPSWTLKYALVSSAISVFFALAMDCADATTCNVGRFHLGLMIAGLLVVVYLLLAVERYIRSPKSGA